MNKGQAIRPATSVSFGASIFIGSFIRRYAR
jgi:hypothetical protein